MILSHAGSLSFLQCNLKEDEEAGEQFVITLAGQFYVSLSQSKGRNRGHNQLWELRVQNTNYDDAKREIWLQI